MLNIKKKNWNTYKKNNNNNNFSEVITNLLEFIQQTTSNRSFMFLLT